MADYTDLLGGGARQPAKKPRSNYSDNLLGGTQGGIPGPPGGQPPADNTAGFMDYMPMSMLAKPYQDIRDIAAEGIQPDFPYFKVPESVAQRSERTSKANLTLAPFAIGGGTVPGAAAMAKRIGASAVASGGHDVAQQAMERGEVDPRRAGMATALGGVGQAGGELIGAGLTRFANRRAARDISRMNRGEVDELRRLAEAEGIQLTPAELTGMKSLAQQQKQVGQTLGAGDDLDDFYRMRAQEQVEPAVNRFLDRISEVEGLEPAGELTRAAANRIGDNVARIRADHARPLYDSAFATAQPVNLDPVLQRIASGQRRFPRGATNRLLGRVQRLLGDFDDAGRFMPEADLSALHGAKLDLDDMIKPANPTKALTNVQNRELIQIKNTLLEAMDTASPDYGSARAVFSDLSPGVERVREGLAGTIARIDDSGLKDVAVKLFKAGRSPGPRAVAEARRQFQATDPDAWQGIKRAFLEEKWIEAGKETLGGSPVNRGAKFRKALLGDRKQRQILEQALDPGEFSSLENLSRVLDASGRVKPLGSDTAWNQEILKAARSDSASPLSSVMKYASPNVLRDAAAAWDDARFLAHSEEVVRMITSPQGVELLRELRQLSPHQQFARAILGRALIMGSANAANVQSFGQGGAGNVPNAQVLPPGMVGTR